MAEQKGNDKIVQDLVGEKLRSVVEEIEVFLFDCDGVLWRGGEIIPGVERALNVLMNKLQKQVFFVSNNSSISRLDYQAKFQKLGLPVPQPEQIVSSAYTAAWYLNHHLKDHVKKVYVFGESGIEKELSTLGIPWIGGEAHASIKWSGALAVDPDVNVVLCGIDRGVNYYKIAYASRCLQNPACKFFATNADPTLPSANNTFLPGGGATFAPLLTATSRKPEKIFGKPSLDMFELVKSQLDIKDLKKVLMIGDRLDTDILFGSDAGVSTCLVGSGAHSKRDVEDFRHLAVPDFFLPSVADIAELWQ